MLAIVATSLVIWGIILLLPWQPYRTRERLEATTNATHLSDALTVLIPARNEADCIEQTLVKLTQLAPHAHVVVIDDQSTDNTCQIIENLNFPQVTLVHGQPLEAGWSGKLWALEQGLAHANTEYTLLLDADIEVQPGIIDAILQKMKQDNLQLLSLMARLRMISFWEKTLIPAFIYFFKFLYPFRLINHPKIPVAGAAGGCLCIATQTLKDIGGFKSIKEALIDDCTLAKKVKRQGGRIWLGLTHSVVSTRAYDHLNTIWEMVTRTAFTQLHYSLTLLVFCTLIMLVTYIVPVIAILSGHYALMWIGALSWAMLSLSYVPTIKYYQLHWVWIIFLPFIALTYLMMTWHSAIRYWFGVRSKWKSREYSTSDPT